MPTLQPLHAQCCEHMKLLVSLHFVHSITSFRWNHHSSMGILTITLNSQMSILTAEPISVKCSIIHSKLIPHFQSHFLVITKKKTHKSIPYDKKKKGKTTMHQHPLTPNRPQPEKTPKQTYAPIPKEMLGDTKQE
jgi:hypothetical protein